MHFKEYNQIAFKFHGDAKVAQGVPYCIAALENILHNGTVRTGSENSGFVRTAVRNGPKSPRQVRHRRYAVIGFCCFWWWWWWWCRGRQIQ